MTPSLPLAGVRVLDFTWLNAGAKGTRHLSVYGAELIHLEWKGKLDALRTNPPFHTMPEEGPPEANVGAGGYEAMNVASVNRAASFNNNHSGKWGIGLNMRHPKGKDLFRKLVKTADAVVDNFTAATLADWGFPFEELERVKPDIIYVQSPGFGNQGPYRDYRTYGPTAAAIAGLTSQVGLPDRYPCGYGFSFMDVCAPYFNAMAVMAALRQRNRTGKGVYVDLSQAGPAFLLTGTSIPEWSANGTPYVRTGNRSPYSPVAPHGIYRCAGEEAWLSIACSTEAHWQALVEAMGRPKWTGEPRFASLEQRCANQDDLDGLMESWTQDKERYSLMEQLQKVGVPAAACQNTRDRYETDPQLKHRDYFVTVQHSEVPEYPVEGHPSLFSGPQPTPRGTTGWGAAVYAEHNSHVYGELLGLDEAEMTALAEEGVI